MEDIARNASLSFMTVLILVLMLLSVNTIVAVRLLTNEATKSLKDQIDVSLYFNSEAEDDEIKEVRRYIESFTEVKDTVFLTSEESLANFKNAYKDSEKILNSLEELAGNPLGATLIVKTREPKDYEKIISAISSPEYEKIIDAKTFGDTERAINKIHNLTNQIERFTVILAGLFATIAFVIIFNTIRVTIYTHRIEISIKKLVGASNWFVRGPYLMESLIFTVISLGLAMVCIYFAAKYFDPVVASVLPAPALLTSFLKSHILVLVGGQFLAVLLLTTVTSTLAMRRYLKV